MQTADGSRSSWYGIALVCANGHVLADDLEQQTARKARFCPECGEGTTSECPECGAPIRGRYHERRLAVTPMRKPPAFCHECGEPYPWTQDKLRAAADLLSRMKRLSPEEREALAIDFREIMTDNPRTQVAALDIKSALGKAGKVIGPLLRDLVGEIATEAARRIIFPN